jgi:dihydrofolate synthase / folylpolyglutamate synthase
MDLQQAVAYLDRHINRGITLEKIDDSALDNMRSLARAFGDPQVDTPIIQVTGTNGKGSTATMISAMLGALGLSVGTYGSPHVSLITERIQRNGEPIATDDLADVIELLQAVEPSLDFKPTWFELLTAAAYRYFADSAVDVAVVEVGMLGRFDATSIADPAVAVVTNVGYDHTDGRDGWRRSIAWEKAGIIKPGTVLCLGETDASLEDLFIAENPAGLLRRGSDFDCIENLLAVGGRHISLRSQSALYEEVFLSLHGAHQGDNAAIAVAAAEAFIGTALPHDVVEEGLGSLRIPGRFEVLGGEPLVILDCAHNPDGAAAASATLADGFTVAGRKILLVGMMSEKNVAWMLEELGAATADLVICTQAPSTPRAMPARTLAKLAAEEGYDVECIPDPAAALDRALALSTEDDLVFGAGSVYIAGALRDAWFER